MAPDGGMAVRASFAEDLRLSLMASPKRIAPKYFYDDVGSQLFETICRLPWYRVTRAELGLLRQHGRSMLDFPGTCLVELGCGSGEKLATLVHAVGDTVGEIQLVDISPAALDMATRRLAQLGVDVTFAHVADYLDGFAMATRARPSRGPLTVLFLGSNIGNFDPPERRELLTAIRRGLRPGDALLLGTDLVKGEQELQLAYDDPLRVTAAFNLNVLRRINDELGGTFDLGRFHHRAVWNAAHGRVEMHLVSQGFQRVAIPGAGLDLQLQDGEFIWTESSYKFAPDQVRRFGMEVGFSGADQWVDSGAGFAVTRFLV